MLEKLAQNSLVGMTGAFIVWSVYFVAIYAFLSIGCVVELDRARLLGVDAVRFTLLVLTAIAFLLIAYYGWRSLQAARGEPQGADAERDPRRFMALVAALAAGLALVSAVWTGVPIFLLGPCG